MVGTDDAKIFHTMMNIYLVACKKNARMLGEACITSEKLLFVREFLHFKQLMGDKFFTFEDVILWTPMKDNYLSVKPVVNSLLKWPKPPNTGEMMSMIADARIK